jgi:hypothetical protein
MNKYVQKLNHVNKISILKTKYEQNQQQKSDKTMLSPQGPQWSRHSVARVRRRGDRPPTLKCVWGIW